MFRSIAAASLVGAMALASAGSVHASNSPIGPPSWEVTLGSTVPTPISVMAVRGRVPGFKDPDVTYVVAFVNFAQAQSRQSIPDLDRLQTEYGKKVAVVAITDQGPDDARAFIEGGKWAPRIGFVVAADPQRSAFRSYFGPQVAPDLPVAFVIRNGLVQWTGNPAELAHPVAGNVRGDWDLAAARRASEQRALWTGLLERVESLAADKQFDEALTTLDDACSSAIDDQKGQCLGVRFSLLLRANRIPAALAVGEQILKAPMNAKQPAGLAWTLVNYAPQDAAAREFALRAALASDAALRGRDAMVAAIVARVQFANGQRTQAIETARRALSLAETPDMQDAVRADLKKYQATESGAVPSAN
ncbi:MAG: redoxin domain-containing protein [Phycisphaerae bacterium]|nr:redoxin domain-containing protein [Phycisphaerae bacterium]